MKLRVDPIRQRRVYLQMDAEPCDDDPEVAYFETWQGAQDYVEIVNGRIDEEPPPLGHMLRDRLQDWVR